MYMWGDQDNFEWINTCAVNVDKTIDRSRNPKRTHFIDREISIERKKERERKKRRTREVKKNG